MDNSMFEIQFSWNATALLLIAAIWSLSSICFRFVLKKANGFADGRVVLATFALYFAIFAAWRLGKIILLIARLASRAKEDANNISYEIGYHVVMAVPSLTGIVGCYIIFVRTVAVPTIKRGRAILSFFTSRTASIQI